MLSKPMAQEYLVLYLVVSTEAISVILIREMDFSHILVDFAYKVQVTLETRYQKMEKVVLARVVASRMLWRIS